MLILKLAVIFIAATACMHRQNLRLKSSLKEYCQGPPRQLEFRLPVAKNSHINILSLKNRQRPEVQKWLKYYQKNRRLLKHLQEGERYRGIIQGILHKADLPPDLYYLALIESGFKIKARSPAKAAGIWQFMAPTARRYGLQVNRRYDERDDPIRATLAAAQYLKALYRVFQSWELTLAAYNSGESRVLQAVMRDGTREFWKLRLPRETRNYVPKFIAAALIGKNPKHYKYPSYRQYQNGNRSLQGVCLHGGPSLSRIAYAINVPTQKLKDYNPQLRTHLPQRPYLLWLPRRVSNKGMQNLRQIKLSKLSKDSKYSAKSSAPSPTATKPRKNSTKLVSRPNSKVKVKKGLVPRRPKTKRTPKIYRVSRGDTLRKIAKRFQIPWRQIKNLNRLRSHLIYPGQTLKLY